ncbi:MAG: hypothetical protein ACRCT8_01075 [Lacipirellulaceae bacterium]
MLGPLFSASASWGFFNVNFGLGGVGTGIDFLGIGRQALNFATGGGLNFAGPTFDVASPLFNFTRSIDVGAFASSARNGGAYAASGGDYGIQRVGYAEDQRNRTPDKYDLWNNRHPLAPHDIRTLDAARHRQEAASLPLPIRVMGALGTVQRGVEDAVLWGLTGRTRQEVALGVTTGTVSSAYRLGLVERDVYRNDEWFTQQPGFAYVEDGVGAAFNPLNWSAATGVAGRVARTTLPTAGPRGAIVSYDTALSR